MNVSAIDPTASASLAAPKPPAKKAQPASAPTVAALATPAATVSTTAVPATVKPEDRQVYLQMLKALGGNVNAALAALAAKEAAESAS